MIYLQIGDIVLIKGKNSLSRVIEEIEDSVYSHAAGIVKENEIIEVVLFEKTSYESLDSYKGYADIFTCDSLNNEQRDGIVKYAENHLGSYYDLPLLLWEFIRYAAHIILPYKQIFQSYICSTLWAEAYRSVGIDLCPNIKYPSPKDLSESKLLTKIGSY